MPYGRENSFGSKAAELDEMQGRGVRRSGVYGKRRERSSSPIPPLWAGSDYIGYPDYKTKAAGLKQEDNYVSISTRN